VTPIPATAKSVVAVKQDEITYVISSCFTATTDLAVAGIGVTAGK
jgi:hypothetical protein